VSTVPTHQVHARHTERTVTVYQAYPPAIADVALTAGTFVGPFRRERMTWIKPSLRWMAHRSGWASKLGQERVLAVEITRAGLHWALGHAALTHHDRARHASTSAWRAELVRRPVRVQWDPERDLHLRPLPHRTVQVGLGGEAVDRYVDDWIVGLTDVTERLHAAAARLAAGDEDAAAALVPVEPPYPLPPGLAEAVGASG